MGTVDWNSPHRRFNPLTGEWVLVSPQRTKRPWLGQVESGPQENLPDYDPDCYLCPGNKRSNNQRNPNYSATYVFDNDFPALLPGGEPDDSTSQPGEILVTDQPKQVSGGDNHAELYLAERERGICRVVCFSPRHNATLPDLPNPEIELVVNTWIEQTLDLKGQDYIHYVQVFENKGAMMGASNPHPHCQVWATEHLPNEPAKELACQESYYSRHDTCLLCDYLEVEKQAGTRVVLDNEHFTALVPYWAVWPFEIILLANRHVSSLPGLSPPEASGLADMLRRLTTRYDNLFKSNFPYSMGFHQAPMNDGPHSEWHLHAHYYPPLLRSATVRKFMVGFEMLASPQRDLTPETAAERLRSLSDTLYRHAG